MSITTESMKTKKISNFFVVIILLINLYLTSHRAIANEAGL